ncbi:MAG TPA: hypothetical protein VHV82_12235 [Sporichthyaceae bacterium]|nr:hypothetical protein [Sporichthyaceae bacterium]
MSTRRASGTLPGHDTQRLARPRFVAAVLVAVAAGVALGSVGAYAAPAPEPAPPPAAGPAAEALSAGNYQGAFANVADAPAGTKPITGTATMVISATGTKVSLAATDLDPKAVYVAHVHSQPCAISEGGTHFQFDPKGPPAPPNELWLTPVTVDPTGKATAGVTATQKANSSAKSVVIHLKRPAGATADEAKPPKLACADLARSAH